MQVLLFLILLLGCREELSSKAVPPQTNPKDDYERMLLKVVTRDGYVNYERLRKQRKPLDTYVAWLHGKKAWRGARPTERHADWLNAYNALVLFQILERGTPDSVRDIPGWFGGPGARFFSGTQFQLGPDTLSLNEIEHELLTFPGSVHDDQVDCLAYGVRVFLEALAAQRMLSSEDPRFGGIRGMSRL